MMNYCHKNHARVWWLSSLLWAGVVLGLWSQASVKADEEISQPPVVSDDILAGEEVDLELVLAVDISFSVDFVEARTQREGYGAALMHPSVLSAIKSGFLGKIAVTYVEWADSYEQIQLVDWMVISDEKSAATFVAVLEAQPLNRGYRTSISHAIDFSAALFEENGYQGLRHVIDVSGDGPHNQGRPLSEARAAALDRGITINGLPILNDRVQPWGFGTPKQEKLDLYYSENVIGGPGAFMVSAEGFEDFRSAILSKLMREIADGSDMKPRQLIHAGLAIPVYVEK